MHYQFEIVNLVGKQNNTLTDLKDRAVLVLTDDQKTIDYCQENCIPVAACEDIDCSKELQANFILADWEQVEDNEIERVYCRQKGLAWIPFESERFLFKEFAMENLDELFELYAKPHVTDYLEDLFPYEEEKEYGAKYIKYVYEFYNFGMWLVLDKATGELVGRAGLESRDTCQGDELELGFIVAPEYQRRGYATEICNAILDYANKWLEIDHFVARCDPRNEASKALLKKIGFVPEKDLLNDGDMLWKKY